VKIYKLKLKRRTTYRDSIDVNNEFECEFYSFENNIDVGCYNPENWDIMMRSYINKRATP